jgi:hypothetical protein
MTSRQVTTCDKCGKEVPKDGTYYYVAATKYGANGPQNTRATYVVDICAQCFSDMPLPDSLKKSVM